MKKTFFVLFLAVLSVSAVFAGDIFSIDWLTFKPLYEESSFDPYGFNTSIGAVYFPKAEDAVLPIRAAVSDGEKVFYADFLTKENVSSQLYIKSKISAAGSLFNITVDSDSFPKIEAQAVFKGYINSMFNGGGANEMQGFDGSYLYGLEMKVADKFAFRFGLHHLSGHFGDEALSDMRNNNTYAKVSENKWATMKLDGEDVVFYDATQYVRDNEWLISLSYDAPLGFRPYAQLAWARNKAWIRPFIHNPSYNFYPASRLAYIGENIDEQTKIAESEEALKDKTFCDMRINAGLDWSKSFGRFGLYAGFDVQAYQDEQTLHQTASYSKNNPWGFDCTFGLGVELYNAIGDRSVAVEIIDHYGRIPLLNFFYKKANLIYIGVSVK